MSEMRRTSQTTSGLIVGFLPRLGLIATRLAGRRAGFRRLVWQWHRFELHFRRHSLSNWRRLIGLLVVFGIAHHRNPFVPPAQLATLGKVPHNRETL